MARLRITKVSLVDVEYIAHRLAQELMDFNEPIPPFDTRFPDKLESCLKTPFQTFDHKSLYQTIETKASILFYLMIKNHPFQNGNKRVVIMTLIYFLVLNRRRLTLTNQALYEFSKGVASSNPRDKDSVLATIRDRLIKNSTRV